MSILAKKAPRLVYGRRCEAEEKYLKDPVGKSQVVNGCDVEDQLRCCVDHSAHGERHHDEHTDRQPVCYFVNVLVMTGRETQKIEYGCTVHGIPVWL